MILIFPRQNTIEVSIDGVCHEKEVTPRDLRTLARRLLEAADEAETVQIREPANTL